MCERAVLNDEVLIKRLWLRIVGKHSNERQWIVLFDLSLRQDLLPEILDEEIRKSPCLSVVNLTANSFVKAAETKQANPYAGKKSELKFRLSR